MNDFLSVQEIRLGTHFAIDYIHLSFHFLVQTVKQIWS